MESTITAKGQATIPKPIRDHLGLAAGDHVKFFIHPDGTVVLLPKRPVTALRGIVKSGRKTATLEEIDTAIGASATEGLHRGRRR